jgi:hypothetical protein
MAEPEDSVLFSKQPKGWHWSGEELGTGKLGLEGLPGCEDGDVREADTADILGSWRPERGGFPNPCMHRTFTFLAAEATRFSFSSSEL